MTVPYCNALDVFIRASQTGVDLRQDDVPSAIMAQTFTTDIFTQPFVGSAATLAVGNGLWPPIGEMVYVVGAGYYLVQAVGATSLVLMSLGSLGDVGPGLTIASNSAVCPSYLAAYILMASMEIDEYCLTNYSQTSLAASDWVTAIAANIAVYKFCTRRGNPPTPGSEVLYAEAKDKLERVSRLQLYIPNTPLRKACVPRMSNIRPALRPHPHTVVETMRSTGTPSGYAQNRDPWDMTGINNPVIYDWSI